MYQVCGYPTWLSVFRTGYASLRKVLCLCHSSETITQYSYQFIEEQTAPSQLNDKTDQLAILTSYKQ